MRTMSCNHHLDEKRVCSCVETYQAIVAGENMPKAEAWCALCRLADAHPNLLTSFQSDLLVVDRRFCEEWKGPFLFVLSELHTIIVRPVYTPGNFRPSTFSTHIQKGDVIAWWDGERLRKVTLEKGLELWRDELEKERREGSA